MTDIIEAILDKDLESANALFEQEMNLLVSLKLVEMKKKVAAMLFESTNLED